MAFPTGTINNEEKLFPTLPNNNIAPIRPQQDDVWGKDGDAFFYNGTMKMNCPPGLVWSSKLKACDWPPKPPAPKPPAPKPPTPDTQTGAPPPGAIVAETLKDFSKGKGVDDSLVFPRGAAPEIVNITQVAPRHFKFVLRHRGNPWSPFNPRGTKGAWYDGDRNLEWNEGKRDKRYHDKSRAEVNGLPAKISNGDTWDIATTVKLDKNFVPSQSYCNLMQPVFDGSFLSLTGIKGNVVTGSLFVFPNGIGSGIKTARDISIPREQWVSIVVRIKFAKDGFYQMSINGDAFKGIKMDTTKARFPYSNKWGLYCTATTDVTGKPMVDSIVEHKNIYMKKVA